MSDNMIAEGQALSANKIGRLSLIHPPTGERRAILSDAACDFLSDLIELFAPERDRLLLARPASQIAFDAGTLPDFLPEGENIRHSDWRCHPLPDDLTDRRVEITGPTDRKMVINALNANVKCFMADFEDSLTPTWDAVIDGQVNLRDAVNSTISYQSGDGRRYQLHPDPAVLICRVRGLHLDEKHLSLDDYAGPVPSALMDFALYFFHNHENLLANGSGPYFYLPKLQDWHEAAWWSKVFCYAEDRFSLPRGTIKATMLIETLPAVFQMHEILFALKEHAAGLNCGRWDYIFSYIKTLKEHKDRVLPDRQLVTMDKSFLNAYSRLLIQTCHRRGVLAMGGMSAFIPSKDPAANEAIFATVRADKELEANNGHDGTWVAHPGLADLAMEIFSAKLGDNPNQLEQLRVEDTPITARDLLEPCVGERTEAGMRANIRIALQYIEAWLGGNGCVPIYGLMEDAATAEVSRASIWQWLHHGLALDNGETVTRELFARFLEEESQVVKNELGAERFAGGQFDAARELLKQMVLDDKLEDFLTLPAYRQLDQAMQQHQGQQGQ